MNDFPPAPPPSVPQKKYLWEVLVPCQWNDGKPVHTRHHRVWDRRVREVTGGLTIMRPAKGQWVDATTAKLYEERMIPVRVMATQAELRDIIRITVEHYQQLAVMFFQVSDEVQIVKATEAQRSKFNR